MKNAVYNLKGEKIDSVDLPEKIFGVKWNSDLIHQVVESMRTNRRQGTVHAKARGEVSGGGRKPWRQKGTGRARHGSTRSPIWAHGGTAHGPTNLKKYGKKINKNAKRKALFMVLARKNADNEIVIADEVRLESAKTKKAKEALFALSGIKEFSGLARENSGVMVVSKDRGTYLAFRNIPGVKVFEARNMNPLDLLSAKYVILGREDIPGLVKEKK